mmetsp:Transcript_34235/g.89662  ORF Transcript_34235/g.89662 Transcript_34235/m.89662 type:complete len:214 (+) Transcript_34235:903-1544(+)
MHLPVLALQVHVHDPGVHAPLVALAEGVGHVAVDRVRLALEHADAAHQLLAEQPLLVRVGDEQREAEERVVARRRRRRWRGRWRGRHGRSDHGAAERRRRGRRGSVRVDVFDVLLAVPQRGRLALEAGRRVGLALQQHLAAHGVVPAAEAQLRAAPRGAEDDVAHRQRGPRERVRTVKVAVLGGRLGIRPRPAGVERRGALSSGGRLLLQFGL